jgi:hypothetical protein
VVLAEDEEGARRFAETAAGALALAQLSAPPEWRALLHELAVRYPLLRFFLPARSGVACSDGGTMRDLHSLAAPGTPGVPDGVVSRRRDARGETTKERERIHLDGDGPVGEPPWRTLASASVPSRWSSCTG